VAAAGRSRREWGWHPLVDEWAARIVADARIRPGERVFDLGAGSGALTRHLVAAGARVVAVELHPGRAAALRERFDRSQVQVVEGDVLDLYLPERPFRVVANPPYAVAGPLLRLLLGGRSGLRSAHLVLPVAVIRRQASTRRWLVEPAKPLPRNAFRPPPRVDSAVVGVRRR